MGFNEEKPMKTLEQETLERLNQLSMNVFDRLFPRLISLESHKEHQISENNSVSKRINEIEERINRLEETINLQAHAIAYKNRNQSRCLACGHSVEVK